jgi:UV DNA damage endonuclease
MRLGFPVKVLGQPGLRSHDSRRWQNRPHLSVSLAYLRDTILYLERQNIRMYRMASDLAPYVAHPDLAQFHSQIEDCHTELAAVGEMVARADLRLSFHLPLTCVLNARDETVAQRSAQLATVHARILEGMGLGPEAVIVTHVGGLYGDRDAALARFIRIHYRLPPVVRRRLVLENDDRRFSVSNVMWVHERTGIPLVFDYLHFRNFNPEKLSTDQALEQCLGSWAPEITPKIHFSSPRTAMRIIDRRPSGSGSREPIMRAPRTVQHSDFVDPYQFADFLRGCQQISPRAFDVMLEAKAKDLAVLHLRQHMSRIDPTWDRGVGA